MMDAVQVTLRRIRNWFVVWFVVQSIAGTAAAVYVLDGLRRHRLVGQALNGVSNDFIVSAGILGSMLLLVLALLVMASLVELRPWARITLLVVGWVTVLGAILGLLTLPGLDVFLGPAATGAGGDWHRLEAVSAFTKVVDLAFWSWAIYILQFDPAVRRAFCGTPQEPAGSGSC